METTNINTGVNSLSSAKSFRVVIANDPDSFTSEKYNKVINGFTTEEAADKAALAAVEEIAKVLGKGATVVYSETLNAFVVWSGKGYYGRVILITAKVEEVETANTETAMTTTDNVTTAITNELNARKDKSAWSKAVTAYALELVETLDNWDKQPESVAELREMILNGAADWNAYSWGGSSLIYNQDIAERVCTPSELKRVTTKNGLRDMANAREHWLDVQARALYQAANLICNIANNYFNA